MYPPQPSPRPAPSRPVWQHPALIITLLVLFPPAGIVLVWLSGWRRSRKIVATAISAVWFIAILTAPDGNETAEGEPAANTAESSTTAPDADEATAAPEVADHIGQSLTDARRAAEAEGYGVTSHDATGGDAGQGDENNWIVCFQDPEPGAEAAPGTTVDFAVVPDGTPCPPADGEPVAYPRVPEVVGDTFDDASAILHDVGLRDIRADSAYADVELPTEYGDWTVCFQDPADGTEIRDAGAMSVELLLVEDGTGCPTAPGSELYPEPEPESVYFENCDAVRAAGQAPLSAGDPGYRPGLDRDGDGVACEPSSGSSSASGGSGGSGGDDGGGSVYYENCDAARAAGRAPLYEGDPGYRPGLDRDGDGDACE